MTTQWNNWPLPESHDLVTIAGNTNAWSAFWVKLNKSGVFGQELSTYMAGIWGTYREKCYMYGCVRKVMEKI